MTLFPMTTFLQGRVQGKEARDTYNLQHLTLPLAMIRLPAWLKAPLLMVVLESDSLKMAYAGFPNWSTPLKFTRLLSPGRIASYTHTHTHTEGTHVTHIWSLQHWTYWSCAIAWADIDGLSLKVVSTSCRVVFERRGIVGFIAAKRLGHWVL